MNATRNFLILACVVVALCATSKVRADFTFGQRVNLGPVVNSPYLDYSPFIAPDGLSLYFTSRRPGGLGGDDIWVTTRATVRDAWEPPTNLGAPVNGGHNEGFPRITADELTLVFSSDAPGGLGGLDIWVSTRPTKESPWGPPTNLGSPVNSATDEFCGCISPDGCSLHFSTSGSRSPGSEVFYGGDVYMAMRPTKDSPWGSPVNLGLMPSRGGSGNWDPSISADSLALFFASDYANVALFPDVWLATRTSSESKWGTPILLGPEINTSNGEANPSISADGSTLYFSSYTGSDNSGDLWQSTILPTVDFNGDRIVDVKDLLRLIESWGKDDPSVDMGPMPWGDGKVDAKDLEILMRYWGEEAYDPALIAYWKLDEVEGTVAADKAGTNNATLVGDPLWRPAGGKIGGALQLDGIDDCVRTPFVVDPAQGSFSVWAWIKGGAPGQVLLSQQVGAYWLCVDAKGRLTTELKLTGRSAAKNLTSSAVIADGAWHRVGLVWDGGNRILYVDDIEVGRDTLEAVTGSGGGLAIGSAYNGAAGTFWSGLIDDVRIYNRAVKP